MTASEPYCLRLRPSEGEDRSHLAAGPPHRSDSAPLRLTRLKWRTCGGRFQRNLAVLVRRHPELAELDHRWSSEAENYELYRATDGNYQIARKATDSRRFWLPRWADHRGEQNDVPLPWPPGTLMPNPCVFDGVGYGWLLRRVYVATKHTFLTYSTALFILEPDPIALAMALHLHDWTQMLDDPRVYWFIGPSAVRSLTRLLRRDRDLPSPMTCIRNGLPSTLDDASLVGILQCNAQWNEKIHERSMRRVSSRYQGRNASYWAARFTDALTGNAPPLRILAATSRYTTFLQYSMRDSARAFEKLGHECRVLIEPSDHHTLGNLTCHQAVLDFKPDLFFIIDHLRSSHRGAMPDQLPFFTWDQDLLPHVFTRQNLARLGPFDLMGGHSKQFCVTQLHCDPRRICASIMPTNPEVYCAEPMVMETLAPYRCDVSYVSNASQTPHAFHEEEKNKSPDETRRLLLDGIYDLAVQSARDGGFVGGARGEWILPAAEQRTGIRVIDPAMRLHLQSWYLWRLADRLFRHQALEWVAEWATRTGRLFHLYGRGWDKHPTLGPFARGVAQNGHELRSIYQATAINLQLMPAGFLHQRSLDGLAAGGFFLTRQCGSDFHQITAKRISERMESLRAVASRTELSRRLPDPELQTSIEEYHNLTGYRWDPVDPLAMTVLECLVEQDCAGAVFPRFQEIIFHDRSSFESAAERFLADADDRRGLVEEMRSVVVERYTYVRTMDRYLRFTRDWFVDLASRGHEA